MAVVVNDGLLTNLLEVQPRTFGPEWARADRYGGDPIGAGTEPRQLQRRGMRRRTPCVQGTNTTTSQKGGTSPCQELTAFEEHQIDARA